MTRVSSTGGCGGEASPPQTLQLPPQKVLTINTISGFMFFCALVIDTQKWAQKLCMLHTQLIFAHNLSPKQKILDETLHVPDGTSQFQLNSSS